ncbi:uncharacterized protein LOC107793471 [Nicotiana tabacum]|uniref:Uncharacterized protein LOC107793471 n=1 Tax=Nicotiana tabacum TaxID=4097 RepID=A0AC58TGV3_TOBAC
MDDKFEMAHAVAKKVKTRVNNIFAIKKYMGEGLRDFLSQFNRVRITLPNVSEGMAVTAFQNGLSREGSRATRKLLSQLMKYPPTTWDEIHNAYHTEVRADDNDLNGPTRWIVLERKHKTKDYITLKQEVVNILQQGHLKKLLSNKGRNNFARVREHQGPPKPSSLARTINMIISDNDDASINSVKFIATRKLKRSIMRERYAGLEESIIFDESNIDGLTFPHNDALVITLQILDTDVKHIMVDNGSGACIIHPRVLTQMRLKDKIVPRCITLTGFNNAVERTSSEITLPILASSITLETMFHIIDRATTYNAIVGRL